MSPVKFFFSISVCVLITACSLERTKKLFIMKRLFCLIILCSCALLAYAQADRTNNFIIRANYNTNIFNTKNVSHGHVYNYKPGFSIDFGAKQFIVRKSGWFIEEVPNFFYNSLPYCDHLLASGTNTTKPLNGSIVYYLKEAGVGLLVVFGHDFILNNNISLSVFGGPDFRYTTSSFPKECKVKKCPDHKLKKGNLGLRFGAGLNYKKLNINLSINPDLLDRGYDYNKYKSVQVSLGVGYYFK